MWLSTSAEKEEMDTSPTDTEKEEMTEENGDAAEVVEEVKEEEVAVAAEEDFKSKYYYLAAEMENLRKRQDREKQNFIKYGNEKILSHLIEVVDNLDRSLDAIRDDQDEKVKNILVGVDMVRNQFVDVLKKNGLEVIEALGEIFDPNLHEAMAQQPAEGKKDQEIIQEFQKGYQLNGRLLRATKVIVAKNN